MKLFFRCNPGAREWPSVSHREGDTADVPDDIAASLIAAGIAIAVPEVAEAKQEPVIRGNKEARRK